MNLQDILTDITNVKKRRNELKILGEKLSNKSMDKNMSVVRNTEGMGGVRYQDQHENVKEIFANFSLRVINEKEIVLEILRSEIRKLGMELEDLEDAYEMAAKRENDAKDYKKYARVHSEGNSRMV